VPCSPDCITAFASDVDTSYIEVAGFGKQAQKRHRQLQNDAGQQSLSYGFAADAAKALNWLAAMGADEAIAGVPFNRFDESAALSAAAKLAPSTARH
jgi:spore coat protein U-like protein